MSRWKGIVGTGFSSSDFDAYVQQLTFLDWRPQFVVLHNTSVPTLARWHDVPGTTRMTNLASYYRDQQQWSGGPHLFIADDLIWVFTPLITSGVHSPSWNRMSRGVEMVGDYQKEKLPQSVLDNTIAALAALHSWAGLDPASLRLHREDPGTTHKSCPGIRVKKAEIIEGVQEALALRFAGEHMKVRPV